MSAILLDTSVLLDHLRGDPAATDAFLSAVANDQDVRASVVSKTEILAGMRTHERHATRLLFRRLAWEGIDDSVAELAGEYARLYRRSHQGIDVPDYLIAATAARLNAALWTANVKHFPMFMDLESPY